MSKRWQEYDDLGAAPADEDGFLVRDASDTTDHADGTVKEVLWEDMLSGIVHNATQLQGSDLDATVGSPSDGDILVFRDLGSDWVLEAKPAGSSPNVNDLGDVTITAVADNEVLTFDSGTGDWINQAITLDGISDVVITSVANNEVLAFDTASGDWTNQTAVDAALQSLLSTTGVTVRAAAGDLDFSGGSTGQVWTVQADGSVIFAEVGSHTHELADLTDAGTLAGLEEVGTEQIADEAVTAAKLENQAGITPGAYTSANITVTQEGIITAVASGTGGSGGLTTVADANTAITIGDAVDGTHRRLTGGTAITLTLDAQGTVGTRVAVTPKGAGAVTAQVESGATYELPLDNSAARTTSFGVTGYVLFEVIANSDDDSAVWDVVGETDHADTADNALDMDGEQITNAVMPLADDEETASFTFGLAHGQQAMVRANHASTPITATVPANATTAFPVGSVININQWGAAAVTIAAAGGVTINKPSDKTLVLRTQYSVVSLWKQATNVWLLFGDLTDA